MNEKLLIAELKSKNKEVFDFVFSYYYSGLCTYALKFVSDRHIVEDIVQDFFVRLWTKGDSIIIKESIKAYFFTAIRNRCLDHIKHSKVKDDYIQHHLSNVSAFEFNPNYFAEAELNEIIQQGLAALPPRCRQIFEMNRLKGKTNEEISKELMLSKRTVELQISNALKILRKELKEYLLPSILLFLLLT